MLATQRNPRIAIGSLAVAGLLSGAAALALGRPDVAAARDFLSTGRPTHDEAVATVQLIVWMIVAVLVLLQVVSALRGAGGVAEQVRRRRTRARVALALGIMIFGGGVLHHQAGTGAICCGDVARADRLVR